MIRYLLPVLVELSISERLPRFWLVTYILSLTESKATPAGLLSKDIVFITESAQAPSKPKKGLGNNNASAITTKIRINVHETHGFFINQTQF
jgi:hypothetical protein